MEPFKKKLFFYKVELTACAFIVTGFDIVHSKEVNVASVLEIYKSEVIRIIQLKTWMSMWYFPGPAVLLGFLLGSSTQCLIYATETTSADTFTHWRKKMVTTTLK